MDPLKLDKFIRCVKRDDGEEWFAYSTEGKTWFPITAEKASWIFGMVPSLNVEKVAEYCRANCYSDVGYDPVTEEVLFEKAV